VINKDLRTLPPVQVISERNMFFKPYQVLNLIVTIVSLMVCIWLSLLRIPGLELFGVTPNWVLIWLVTWSIKRSLLEAVVGGLCCGLILDGLTVSHPSHILPFVVVGVLTVFIYKRIIKKIQEDFISVALIVFAMAILVEFIRVLQLNRFGSPDFNQFWQYQQRVALSTAILSSLWAPVIYLPLNRWRAFIEPSNQLKS
jgi:rod shape-determining protein MreD